MCLEQSLSFSLKEGFSVILATKNHSLQTFLDKVVDVWLLFPLLKPLLEMHTVAIGTDESPVSVSRTGDARRNVIVWMDHRAEEQAERINASKSPVLQFAGGSVSPQHQAPKVLYIL